MKILKVIPLVALIAGASLAAIAQTNVITVTNVVTITITNVVTVTNIVSAPPVVAPAAKIETNVAATVPPPEPKYPWESSVSAGLTLTRGNSHTLLYSSTFQTAKKTPENEYTIGANGAYGSQNSKENVNNYGGFTQWNHLFTERFYSYGRVDGLRDIVADIDYRINIGPGAGYYLIKCTNSTFSLEAGAGEMFQRIGSTTTVGTNNVHTYENESFTTVRFADNFEYKFGDRARIWQKAEILPQVDKFQNYVINFEVGIEASITKTFGLKTYWSDTYQSEPAAGRYRNDAKIVSALFYKF